MMFKRKLKIWVAVFGAVLFLLPREGHVLSGKEKQELRERKQLYRLDGARADELARDAGLEEVARAALLSHAGLEAAFYRWQASVYQMTQARSLEDPRISFETYLGQGEMFAVEQEIPFLPKLFVRRSAAVSGARQYYLDFMKKKLELVYEIKDAWYEYWFLRKRVLVAEQSLELLRQFESVAQAQYRGGLTRNQDLLKAQVELGRMENELLTLKDYREPVVARLNALLNRPWDAPLAWPEEAARDFQDLDEEEVTYLFLENNPDLEQAAARVEETKRKVWLARMDYLPDMMLGVEHERMRGGMGRDENRTSLMFRINIPLWLDKNKSQTGEAVALRQSAKADQAQLAHDLTARLRMLFFSIRDAKRQVLLYRDALVPKAEQSLRASETAYAAGDVDFQNLIDSERTLLDFRLSYFRAIREYEQRLAELEMMVGEPLRG